MIIHALMHSLNACWKSLETEWTSLTQEWKPLLEESGMLVMLTKKHMQSAFLFKASPEFGLGGPPSNSFSWDQFLMIYLEVVEDLPCWLVRTQSP